MDSHLNIFYSYGQGNSRDVERAIQLEDNITRALMITIKSLSKVNQERFLNELLSPYKIKSRTFTVDLQNLKKGNRSDGVQKGILITIQRQRGSYNVGDLLHFSERLQAHESDANKKRSLINSIKYHLAKKKSQISEEIFVEGDIQIPYSELPDVLKLLQGSRADGWLSGDKELILIESKIGWNTVSKYQLYRHCFDASGLQISKKSVEEDESALTIVNRSWEDIASAFRKILPIEIDSNECGNESVSKERFTITQFLEYLNMTGQTLDLSYLTKPNYDVSQSREQFPLFLDRLDEKVKSLNLGLEREGRNKFELWDAYGVRITPDSKLRDPHYTIGFWDNDGRVSIYLTTKEKKQISESFIAELKNFIKKEGRNKIEKQRLILRQVDYRLVDHKKGQIRGAFYDALNFYVQFVRLEKDVDFFMDTLYELSKRKLYKQFEIGYEIRLFDFSKITDKNTGEQIRVKNKELLESPETLIETFAGFIKETKPLFDCLAESK